MAFDYTSGSASNCSDLLTALRTFLLANGWSSAAATGGGYILTKGAAVVRLWAVDTPGAEALYAQGGAGSSGGALTDPAPYAVAVASRAPVPIVFPVTYEFYSNTTPDEVYAVIGYGGNKYQHLNFGVSDIPDIGGTGLWFTGAMREDNDNSRVYMYSTNNYLQTQLSGLALGYFVDQSSGRASSFIHCGLEGTAGWRRMYGTGAAGYTLGQDHMAGLMGALPSNFNESETMLPLYACLYRTDGTQTIVAVMRFARLLRIDNVTPGDLLTYGGEQWRAYPLYAKNIAQRNGVPWTIGADHSGTLGVAIYYEA